MTKAMDSAVRLLTRREHGSFELYEKLVRKGYNEEEVHKVLLECQRLGLQSDKRYVSSFCRLRASQGYGPQKIIQELKNKKLDPELIQELLHDEEVDWILCARDLWEKRCKGRRDLTFEEIQKNQRFLYYRGFTQDIIKEVVREWLP